MYALAFFLFVAFMAGMTYILIVNGMAWIAAVFWALACIVGAVAAFKTPRVQ